MRCDYCVWYCIVVCVMLLGDLRYLYTLDHIKLHCGEQSCNHVV